MRSQIIGRLHARVADDSGQDLIEYALIVGLVALVAVTALTAAGATVRDVFWSAIAAALNAVQ